MSIILLATPVLGAQLEGQLPTADSLATVHLDNLVVTGSATIGAQLVRQSVSQTRTIVERKAIFPTQNAESVLRLLPALDIRERAGKASQADISIRGGAFDGTMVMLNGVDFSDARTGHQSHSVPVDLDIISAIGIVDWVPQPGALAGGVNFVTALPADDYLRVRLEGGAHGYGYGNLSGGFTKGKFSLLAAASHKRSDGYRYNTDFKNTNAYLRTRWGDFDFQAGFQRRDWGSNGSYSLRYSDQFEHTVTALASLKWEREVLRDFIVDATIHWRQNNDRFEMVRDDPSVIPFNRHTTHNLGADLTLKKHWRRFGTLSGGAGFKRNIMRSTPMGNHNRNITTVWLGYEKAVQLRAPGNAIFFEGFGSVTDTPTVQDGMFLGRVALRLKNRWWIHFDAMRSMRMPTFTDLYYNVVTYHPNPNLKPEQATTFRLRAEYRSENGFGVEAATWYRRTRNVIDWEQWDDGDWYSTQLNRLGTFGAEFSASWRGEGFVRTAMASYGYMDSEMTVAANYVSKYALDFLRHKASAVVGFGLGEFTLSFTGSYYDRMGSWIGADGVVEHYKPYFLLDGRLSWQRRGLQIYADGTNLLGTRYWDFGGLTMPRQWFSAGVVVTLK